MFLLCLGLRGPLTEFNSTVSLGCLAQNAYAQGVGGISGSVQGGIEVSTNAEFSNLDSEQLSLLASTDDLSFEFVTETSAILSSKGNNLFFFIV